MGKVLVISNDYDDHIQLVSSISNLEFVLLDPTKFIYNTERLSFYLDPKGSLQAMFEEHNLNDFSVFWYRKPKFLPEVEYPVEEGLQEHCRENYMRMMNTLFAVYKDRFWINHPDTIKCADIKVKQLMVASSLGFNISETLLSNSTEDSIRFINNKNIVVAKTLGQRRIKIGDIYTNGPLTEIKTGDKFQSDLLEDEIGLNVNPHIFQGYSEGNVVRVIAINGKVFAIKTVALKPETLLDSRAIMLSEEYSINVKSEIPEYLSSKCFKFLEYFNLKYGAFDFIERPDGSYLFLECNPNGQWGFVDYLSEDNKIATEFAKLFESV